MSSNLPASPGDPQAPSRLAGADSPISAWTQDPGYGPEPGGMALLQRHLAALARRKWLILFAAVVGTAAGAVATQFVEPEYTAQATLWIEDDKGRGGPIRTDQLLQSQGWIDLLRSYSVLDPVVRQQQLFVETSPKDRDALTGLSLGDRFRPGEYRLEVNDAGTHFVLSTAEGVQVERGEVGGPVGRPVGLDWTPPSSVLRPNRALKFTVHNPREAAIELARQLRMSLGGNNNFLSLALTGSDPQLTASTLNTLIERYVDVAATLKRAKLDELTAVLEEQRQYAEANLRDSELDLEQYRVATITLPSEDASAIAPGIQMTRDPLFSQFFSIRLEREQLRDEREQIERILAQATGDSLALDALGRVGAVNNSATLSQVLAQRLEKRAELRALLRRYTDQHPPVRRLREDIAAMEQQTIPNLAAALGDELRRREAELDGRIGSASGELQQIPPRVIEEARLRRRVAIAEKLHGTLKERYEEARLAAASSIPDIRVLDRAIVPFKPVSEPGPMFVLFGLLGGLGLSVVGVTLLTQFDPKVRYPEQVTHEFGLPILGAVPQVQQLGDGGDDPTRQHASESFREIRLGLVHAHGTAGPFILTVTSPESGAGKSFITAHLALAFADQGHRTIVIDGDIRRGSMHHLLEGHRSPGLTDLLAGDVDLSGVVQRTPFPAVSMIGSGTRRANGPELLGSAAMSKLLVELRAQFDVILVDSPPLGAGVDAYALATLTRNLVVVLRTGETDRGFTNAKLQVLDRLPVRVLGAILNGVPDSKPYRYYSYVAGYDIPAETEHPRQLEGA